MKFIPVTILSLFLLSGCATYAPPGSSAEAIRNTLKSLDELPDELGGGGGSIEAGTAKPPSTTPVAEQPTAKQQEIARLQAEVNYWSDLENRASSMASRNRAYDQYDLADYNQNRADFYAGKMAEVMARIQMLQ